MFSRLHTKKEISFIVYKLVTRLIQPLIKGYSVGFIPSLATGVALIDPGVTFRDGGDVDRYSRRDFVSPMGVTQADAMASLSKTVSSFE